MLSMHCSTAASIGKTELVHADPDRSLPGFLEKNRIAEDKVLGNALLKSMLDQKDYRIVERDVDGNLRFNADFRNAADLRERLGLLDPEYAEQVAANTAAIVELYEDVFDHQSFTGRSGTMFGFEGLGSIYWHMVSKLLLAVQENYFIALEAHGGDSCAEIGQQYYRIRNGIGFNKTPDEYGAFPMTRIRTHRNMPVRGSRA